MTSVHRKRKLSNLKLTREFHFAHMGIWMMISVAMVILFNYMLYLFISQQWSSLGEAFASSDAALGVMHRRLVLWICGETALFSFALVYLAMHTSHRISGPYIRLRSACREIRDGNRERRLKFRTYDRLDSTAAAFNEMLDALYAEKETEDQ